MDGVEASAVVYRLQREGGAEPEELGRFGIRDRIRALAVDEETPIAVKGDDAWRRAGDYPEFRRYFELVRESGTQGRRPAGAAQPAPALPLAESCPNHPDRRSAFGCVTCAAGWCEECVVMPTPGSRIPPLCPKDRSICNPIVYEGTSETLLERCLSAVTYPFAAGGLLYLFFYSVLRLLGGLWFFFPPMTFALLLFLFLAWIYDLEIVRVSAQGQKTLPRFPEGHDVPMWIGRGIKVLVVTLLCWAPFIAYSYWAVTRVADKVVANVKEELARPAEPSTTTFVLPPMTGEPDPQALMEQIKKLQQEAERQRGRGPNPGTSPISPAAPVEAPQVPPGLAKLLARVVAWSAPYLVGLVLVGLFCYSYFWMSLAYAAVWDTLSTALNPARILRGIAACGVDYAIFIGLAIVSTVVLVVLKVTIGVIPFVGGLLTIPVEAAFSFYILHLLGWMVHRHQVDLDWD